MRCTPGHDYIENNLKFTPAREPDDKAARAEVTAHDPTAGHVSARRRWHCALPVPRTLYLVPRGGLIAIDDTP